MPASLQDDAIAYLQARPGNENPTQQQIAGVMVLLDQQPNLRPSYSGNTGSQLDAPEGVASVPAPMPPQRPGAPSGGSASSAAAAPLPPARPSGPQDGSGGRGVEGVRGLSEPRPATGATQVGEMIAGATSDRPPNIDAIDGGPGNAATNDPVAARRAARANPASSSVNMDPIMGIIQSVMGSGNQLEAQAERNRGSGGDSLSLSDLMSSTQQGGDMLANAIGQQLGNVARGSELNDTLRGAEAEVAAQSETGLLQPQVDPAAATMAAINARQDTNTGTAQRAIAAAQQQPMPPIPQSGVPNVPSPNAVAGPNYNDMGRPSATPMLGSLDAMLPEQRQPQMPPQGAIMRLPNGGMATSNGDGTFAVIIGGQQQIMSAEQLQAMLAE